MKKRNLFVAVSVDEKSMLGKIAHVSDLVEELKVEVKELERMVSYEEKRAAESEQESTAENN